MIGLLIEDRRSVEKRFAPFNAIVGVASLNVPAYSNGNDSFYSNENSFLDGIYMGLKWQCVEYARRWSYLRYGFIFESVEGAKDMWNQLKDLQRVKDKQRIPLKRHDNGSPHRPHNDSFLIYPEQREMPYGHVAVIVEVLPSSIRVAEQNFNFYYWKKDYAREIPLVKRDNRYFIEDEYQVFGWMSIDHEHSLNPSYHQAIEDINRKNIQINAGSSLSLSTFSFLLFLFLLY